MGWVFQGNPKKFDIDDYLSRYPELIYWRTPRYAKDIAVGDRAFIWRAGSESGAIAVGTVVELPTVATDVKHAGALGDDLWVASKHDPTEPKTGIHLDEVRLSILEGMVARAVVKVDPILSAIAFIRMASGTVFKLSEAETSALERLWGISATVIVTVAPSTTEGLRRLRSHYVRERSTRLRSDKLKQFRIMHGNLFCELCGEKEFGRYPSALSERIFEVHHRAPLAQAATPVRTTLGDLAVVCANCHRAVHATIEVEANFKTIGEHFARRS